ncbi:SpoIIE family protein phosphatase [Nitrogeniibacter mangrovi]|uniref:SpoIIE family protein phosphatase n=1 Tax=Nitrogeniibacter mangrovi TaxID=2016596 RepID=A0A6C1AYZ7_9RHOO|nr:SpoIIE family protein phosphatase [Nitrogeniibacter mangrovi]QID16591.1 SpoIIE family protein phosphatase [Nitrogeniibacter mangrovi]
MSEQNPQRLSQPTAYAVTLMEHMVVPTFVLDADRRVIVWNRACERLTGIPADRMIGTRDHWQAFYEAERPCLADLVATQDWSTIDKLYTTHDDPGTPAHGVHAENWCAMRHRGERRYLVVDAGPVFDEAGRLIAVVETLRDNTENQLAAVKVREQASKLKAYYDTHEREADLARRILDHQIRSELTRQAGVRYQVNPADNFSGDLVLAARSPDGRLCALLADAVGHGLAAAVSVLPVVQEFYRLVEQGEALGTLVESINFVLANALPVGRFVAAAFVCVDPRSRQGEIWVGGIPDVLMVDEGGRLLRRFSSRHLPLGVSETLEAGEATERFDWTAPARLVLVSDGVIEAMAPDGEAFGETRLRAVLGEAPASTEVDRLHDALARHLGPAPAHDDMSVLVVPCAAGPGAPD